MKNVIIVGAGKFGREVYSWIKQCPNLSFKGFLDNRSDVLNKYNYKEKIIESAETYSPNENDLFICAIGDIKIRKYLCEILEQKGAKFTNLIHPSVILGENISLGTGIIICPGCILSCDVTIGNHVILNMGVTIAHDVIIKDYCQINPRATLNGTVLIEEGVEVGSNACILPDITLYKNSKIGAGSIIIKDAESNSTIFGNPGKKIR